VSERTYGELGKELTVNGGTVLAPVSQADLLVGNEVGAVIVNDAVVNNSQLVPVMRED
jgi:hypothetical protein